MPRPKHNLSRRETDAKFICATCEGKFFTPQAKANHQCRKGLLCTTEPHLLLLFFGPLSGAPRLYRGKILEAPRDIMKLQTKHIMVNRMEAGMPPTVWLLVVLKGENGPPPLAGELLGCCKNLG